jgi:hypothetical protein
MMPSIQQIKDYCVQVDENEVVTVYKDGEFVGRCEAYELDAICRYLGVTYEEVESDD